MRKRKGFLLFVVAVSFVLFDAPQAYAGDSEKVKWNEGMWRLELGGYTAARSGNRSRTGDLGITGSAEYEVPLARSVTFGIRMIPLFFYDENASEGDTFFGAGFGPTFRFYTKGREHRGLFFDVGTNVLVTTGKFRGNSGTINFMSEAGAGWKFENDWHVALKIRHISNSGLAERNSGVNNVGLAFGYSFRRGSVRSRAIAKRASLR